MVKRYRLSPMWPVPAFAAAAPVAQAGSVWSELKSADGKPYWANTLTGASSWVKPAELMSARERADASTGWAELVAEGGKLYWHHAASGALPCALHSAWLTAAARQASPPGRAPRSCVWRGPLLNARSS